MGTIEQAMRTKSPGDGSPDRRCPYCGGATRFRFSASDWNQHSTPENFDYRQCASCALIFIDPLPRDIGRFYVRQQYQVPASAENFELRASAESWKVDLIRPHVLSGDLLEVGPATGEFATAARSAGFSPTLVEMDDACVTFLREKLGHHVVQSDDPVKALRDLGLFDAICVWQTIEHIPRFWTFVAEAALHLRPGGALVVSTPNPVSFQARLLGRTWPHADVPRHLYLVPPNWLLRACQNLGLRPALVTTRDAGTLGLNHYGWYLWVRNRFGRVLSEKRVKAWATRLTRLFARRELSEGEGCCYVAILTKDRAA